MQSLPLGFDVVLVTKLFKSHHGNIIKERGAFVKPLCSFLSIPLLSVAAVVTVIFVRPQPCRSHSGIEVTVHRIILPHHFELVPVLGPFGFGQTVVVVAFILAEARVVVFHGRIGNRVEFVGPDGDLVSEVGFGGDFGEVVRHGVTIKKNIANVNKKFEPASYLLLAGSVKQKFLSSVCWFSGLIQRAQLCLPIFFISVKIFLIQI